MRNRRVDVDLAQGATTFEFERQRGTCFKSKFVTKRLHLSPLFDPKQRLYVNKQTPDTLLEFLQFHKLDWVDQIPNVFAFPELHRFGALFCTPEAVVRKQPVHELASSDWPRKCIWKHQQENENYSNSERFDPRIAQVLLECCTKHFVFVFVVVSLENFNVFVISLNPNQYRIIATCTGFIVRSKPRRCSISKPIFRYQYSGSQHYFALFLVHFYPTTTRSCFPHCLRAIRANFSIIDFDCSKLTSPTSRKWFSSSQQKFGTIIVFVIWKDLFVSLLRAGFIVLLFFLPFLPFLLFLLPSFNRLTLIVFLRWFKFTKKANLTAPLCFCSIFIPSQPDHVFSSTSMWSVPSVLFKLIAMFQINLTFSLSQKNLLETLS